MGVKNLLRADSFLVFSMLSDTANSDGAGPIDYPAIVENPTEFELVATDAATGKPVYFTKDDMKQDDYRAIMASCALPVMCRPISFHNETYFDGGLSDSVPIERAFAKGCDRVVVILNKLLQFCKAAGRLPAHLLACPANIHRP